MEEINRHYLALLERFGIPARIEEAPKRARRMNVVKDGDVFVIRLRPMEKEYHLEFLAYAVREILLPRLVLETPRLRLRRVEAKDAEPLFEGCSDRNTAYLDWGDQPFEEMDGEYGRLMEKYRSDKTRYAICLKEEDRAIGVVNLTVNDDYAVEVMELGYSIVPSRQRKGYAREALSALLELLLEELRLDMVLAGIVEKNEASLHLIRELGFVFEGRRHKAFWDCEREEPVDLLYFYRERAQGPEPCAENTV